MNTSYEKLFVLERNPQLGLIDYFAFSKSEDGVFMNPVNRYLLDSSYVLGVVVDFGRKALNKSKSILVELMFWWADKLRQ